MALTTQTSDGIVDLAVAEQGLIGTIFGHKLPRKVLVCELSYDPMQDRKFVHWITNTRTSDNRRFSKAKDLHSMPFDGTEESALAVLAAMKLTD